ncbi:MAG: hypothetical protein IPF54_23905 [Draconibacterium sp.]|nr:hypothetical protein [Draconibacterium sp.]
MAGTIQTQNTSAAPIPANKTWGGTIQYNALAGGQTVTVGSYNILTLSNIGGTQTASGDISAATFNTTTGGTINMGTNVLSVTNVSHSGILRTQNSSSTPFTAGLTWGGTVVFDGTVGQTIPASTFNNLTISNITGVTAAANQTINGILNLSVANPDATHGSLDMSTFTLNLGANANTIGIGDVTGIISRTTFIVNTIYTYGNTNQYLFFPNTPGQSLPDEVVVRISLLSTAPNWVTNGTRRLYEISQTDGIGTKALFRANYLDSELAGGIDESLLSIWSRAYQDDAYITDEGWSDYNSTENWITLSDVDFQYLPAGLGNFEVTLAPTSQVFKTWNGSQNTTDWNTASNWTPNGVPTSVLGIVIPNVSSSNNFSPDLPVDAEGQYLIIQDGGILNTVSNAELTLSGNGNVWSAEAGSTFNPGNSNVIFTGNISGGAITIAGNTDFYNITISANTTLRPGVDSNIGIANTITNNGVLDAASTHNTIEFKKDGDYSIPNPNGDTPGYHTLILSGTGTKTLPASLDIWHDFINNGTVDAGTGVVNINGIYSLQNIGGTSSTNFYDLVVANTSGTTTTSANITASNSLIVDAGTILQPGSTNTVGGSGTLTGSGTVKVTGLGGINSLCTQYPSISKDLTNLTLDYNGAGNQTVCAENYGNLFISPNGTRTVTFASSGIIGVAGVLIRIRH